ncbi:MAG: hypothetical protein KDD82_28885 [Planctomycetes bacterium]|nr:hypothetical protein [Planctomycetota bacterium]
MVSSVRSRRPQPRSEELAALTERYLWIRPLVRAYFRRRLGAEAGPASEAALASLARLLPRVTLGAPRFRKLVFSVVREHERRVRARRLAARRWAGRPQVLGDFDLAARGHEPQSVFERLWAQAVVLTCLGRLRAERPALYAALDATLSGAAPARGGKRARRIEARIAVYLRREIRGYGRARADVDEELQELASVLGKPWAEAHERAETET